METRYHPSRIPQDAHKHECSLCHDTIWEWTEDDRKVAVSAASLADHECWTTDLSGANLLVIDD
jgi:hypothetical protein